LIANVEAAGEALGEQVNRLADAGAKVLISTIPDLGLTRSRSPSGPRTPTPTGPRCCHG
jgi:hypothetical protein